MGAYRSKAASHHTNVASPRLVETASVKPLAKETAARQPRPILFLIIKNLMFWGSVMVTGFVIHLVVSYTTG